MRVANGHYNLGSISPFGFVAAMPSLHIAFPAVALFTFWPRLPLVRALALALLALTTYATIVTGMHYMIDLLAGLALGWGAVKLSDRFIVEPAAEGDKAKRFPAQTNPQDLGCARSDPA